MKMIRLTAMAAILLGVSSTVHADEAISIKAGYMMLTPSGQFAATVNNTGTRIDLEQDLNFDNSKQFTGEIGISLGDSLFSLAYVPLSFTGNGPLTRPISYNGQTFTTGTTVSSEFKADIIDIGYTYYLVNMDDLPSRIQLGIETAVKTVIVKTSMAGGGINSTKNITVPIPTLGLRGRVALADFIGVVGRVGYLGYAGNRFLDADIQIEFSPLPTVGIYAGYRHLKLELDTSGVFANATFNGPYAGAFFRF
jgi:hypothetical protein